MLDIDKLAIEVFGRTRDGKTCIECNEPFTSKNVFTALGWKETKLSGLCESCWDKLFANMSEKD